MMRIVKVVAGVILDTEDTISNEFILRNPSPLLDNRLIDVPIPKDSGRKTALARLIVHDLIGKEKVCLRIDDSETWASSGNPSLFEAVMIHFGGESVLDDESLIVFTADEKIAPECIVALCLYFCWSFTLWIAGKSFLIYVDTEEYLMVVGDSVPDRWSQGINEYLQV